MGAAKASSQKVNQPDLHYSELLVILKFNFFLQMNLGNPKESPGINGWTNVTCNFQNTIMSESPG